ncbi:6-phosphogluconolactonase [Corynebacterium liangguodongii]|uniref:6-phosphogluconolactonase n=1 Tax=Corynebacterium liangguodongii TaxID=2079535 RepID=A0A2S0WE47_9CORY|nr:6-phosphogluconolactonase [Corynebacterium liangguodongii]AWB84053.1 6-phosphogluconolactonase [Corynebacterium liangguodongii]PWC00064.1 6-phosphogluconolactonase [Corynebacterium liangguodongii]
MVAVSRHSELGSLIDAASARFTELVGAIQSDPSGGVGGDGCARVVVTGGTAGIRFLAALRGAPIDFARLHVFFGDERNVPVSHPDSNEGQAREALLDHVGIPEANIHGYGLDGSDMAAAVRRYDEVLARFAPDGFDLHLLGMGGEGHVNSLFPHTPQVRESERLVVAVTDSPKPPAERATLTLPAVARAERVWLLVSGAEKAEAAGHVARGADPVEWPAAGAVGRAETVLFVSEDAASAIG